MSGTCSTATSTRVVLFTLLVLLSVLSVASGAPPRRLRSGTYRLCSSDLSNAIRLVCLDRGYNEPFSYSGEDELRVPSGPGLVEECCYHTCRYEQLEQYCKPSSEEKRAGSRDVIEESLRIVTLPYSSGWRTDRSVEERPRPRSRSPVKRSIGSMIRRFRRSIRT